MKRILIFSLAYYPSHVSGAEAAIKEITDRTSPEDISFDMVTLRFETNTPLHERIGNVNVYRIGGGTYISKILFPLLAASKARALNTEHQYDAQWAVMTYMLFPVVIGRMSGLTLPYALTLQDGDSYQKVFGRLRARIFSSLLNSGFRHATVVHAISKYLATWPELRGFTGETIVIPNGANPHDIADDTNADDIVRIKHTLGKKEGDIFLVNTARLEHQKGNDVTIRALTFLPGHIKLVLVGSGTEEEKLRALTKELAVDEHVIFVGQVSREEVTLYRKACDIFVGPSRSEGLGNAFLSAMASKLPVVATRVGGLEDFIFDTESVQTAWKVEPDSPEDIANAVTDILMHPDVVKHVTEHAREMVLEKYTWDSVAKQMREKVFAKLLR